MSQEKISQEIEKEIQGLIEGTSKPKSPVTSYLTTSLREANAERIEASQMLQQVDQRATQLRARLLELKGVASKAYTDLAKAIQDDKTTNK